MKPETADLFTVLVLWALSVSVLGALSGKQGVSLVFTVLAALFALPVVYHRVVYWRAS